MNISTPNDTASPMGLRCLSLSKKSYGTSLTGCYTF